MCFFVSSKKRQWQLDALCAVAWYLVNCVDLDAGCRHIEHHLSTDGQKGNNGKFNEIKEGRGGHNRGDGVGGR